VRQGFTDLAGAFSFSQLPAGQYNLCARIPAEQAANPSLPYLDTCTWPQPQPPVLVSAGQTLTGILVLVPQGVRLQVQVNDPQSLLAQITPQQWAQIPDMQLQVRIRQTGGLPYRVPLVSQTPNGRSYSLGVPAGASLLLTVSSSSLNIVNQIGAAVRGEASLPTPTGTALSPVQFTVQAQ